ncbi:MAG: heavy metal translocating P-type ATPase [Gemmobacter sp.]
MNAPLALAEAPGIAACPACAVAPAAVRQGSRAPSRARIVLSVPAAHCAACIGALEGAVAALPGVRAARLNLTLRRLYVDAAPEVGAEAIVAALARVGYEGFELDAATLAAVETDAEGRDLLMRLGVAGFAMMNVMLLSVAVWSGAEAATRDLFHWISGAIALPTVAFAGQPFFRSALRSLRARRLGMDVPISLALILASAISVYETLHSGRHAYFDAAVMLAFFLLAGRYLDHRTRAIARSAAQELAALEVPRAIRIGPAGDAVVAIEALVPGDLVRVLPGTRIPVDGTIEAGESEIDRALLTGESMPQPAAPGLGVGAGEMNLTGALVVRVTAAGAATTLRRMADLVALAESARTRYTSLADRAARAYSPVVHLVALASLGGWLQATGGDWRVALNVAAAVLIITCPCALGLAVPAVVTAASGRLYRAGLLIKSGTALERLAAVDTVVFDKTGTLTLGTPRPVNLDLLPPEALALAAALGAGSAHPLAQALAQAARARGVAPAEVADLREVPGQGVEGSWQGGRVRLGRAGWVGAEPAGAEAATTATWLARPGAAPVAFVFEDSLRPGAEALVRDLQAQGMRVLLLSGDAPGPVAAIAARLGIAEHAAAVLPEEKVARLQALAAEGRRVLMLGDGLNDTGALAQAHVSISPASGLDAARAASDMVLMGRDLAPVGPAIRTARLSVRRIRENFALSALYNIVAVPVAIVGLASPLLAALAMSLSSVTVTLNALRLR